MQKHYLCLSGILLPSRTTLRRAVALMGQDTFMIAKSMIRNRMPLLVCAEGDVTCAVNYSPLTRF
jgi:hypothetical protein